MLTSFLRALMAIILGIVFSISFIFKSIKGIIRYIGLMIFGIFWSFTIMPFKYLRGDYYEECEDNNEEE